VLLNLSDQTCELIRDSILSIYLRVIFLQQEVKDLTASDLFVSLDLSELSSVSDYSTGEPELVQDQPTVAAVAGNLIKPEAWTPIAVPREPIPEEFHIRPKHWNLKLPAKQKQPSRRSARIRANKPKAPDSEILNKKEKVPPKPKGSVLFFLNTISLLSAED
jgi:hypothetical protein